MSRRKKLKSSPPSTAKTIDQQQEQWQRHFDALNPDDQEVVQRGTNAAKAVCGSRLAVAKHLSQVRDVLCRNLTNPKQKRKWTLYLQVVLPGLATSRSQVFRDIQAWCQAESMFPALMLDEFLSSGYALSVRPTVEQPLGKMTEPCQHLLSKLHLEELSALQLGTVLSEAANIIKEGAKKSRAPRTRLTVEKNRQRILTTIHEALISGLEDLSKATEPWDEYNAMCLRDDLELIVCRWMTATGIEALDLEQQPLPEGYKSLKLTVPNPKPRTNATRSSASRAGVAKAALPKYPDAQRSEAHKGTIPVSAIDTVEVPSVA
jgi:hypothetical protein